MRYAHRASLIIEDCKRLSPFSNRVTYRRQRSVAESQISLGCIDDNWLLTHHLL